ncbi:MAG: FtsW/RodA/SpoVE family cell cycle protein [Puniceicoccales bacterium]|jgi:cell division protein FtsW|nr:FtsW/RodA/SpoVE family cell cycle protein [Puniceicoccales bacterium]
MGKILEEYGRYFAASRHLLIVPLCLVFLTVLGLLTLSSASLSFVGPNYLLRQCVWLALALPCCFVALLLPIDLLRRHSGAIALFATILLVVVLISPVGHAVKGSRRWIDLGFLHLQVSELAKLALALCLAERLAERAGHSWDVRKDFLQPLTLLGIFALLLLLEPDYGSTFLFLFVGFTLLFLAGTPLRFLLSCCTSAALLLALFVVRNPVRLGRILAFLDVESTKLTGSYQLWQGLVGFQSGGLHGLGLGNGRQQLSYLPEAHTDFIFPIMAEELGYPFALLAIFAYVTLFAILWLEIYRVHDTFLFLFASGILLFLVAQTVINLAVVMGLFPTKGVALPLVSYGGSNLFLVFSSIGLLLNCFCTAQAQKPRLPDLLPSENFH